MSKVEIVFKKTFFTFASSLLKLVTDIKFQIPLWYASKNPSTSPSFDWKTFNLYEKPSKFYF